MLESIVEDYFQEQVALCGGFTLKFTSPSMRGVPDQIALYNGETYFVELKAPGGKPRDSQVVVHELFEEQNITVHTIDTKDAVDQFIKCILDATPKEKPEKTFDIKDGMFDTD